MRYSLLDLAPIVVGSTPRESFLNSRKLIQLAEKMGYSRYWVAEHHSIPGVASAATSVLIGYLAEATENIRVGAGGIMLPNHAPLVIAEQFGTLEAMFPGRIDLGIGRAPGGDHHTMRALRRGSDREASSFPNDLLELMGFLGDPSPEQKVHAIPGQGSYVPIYLLGSSTFSAQLAAELGLPFAFASHFAPTYLHDAIRLYRQHFKPSSVLSKPYLMVAVNVIVADCTKEAERLFTSLQQLFLNMVRGIRKELSPPLEKLDWSPREELHVKEMTRISAVGDADTVLKNLVELKESTQADELIITSHIYDIKARLYSFKRAAEILQKLD